MFGFFQDAANSVLTNVVQILFGCVLAMPVYFFTAKNPKRMKTGFLLELLWIAIASFCGAILPIGTYGVVPIVAALLAVGLNPYFILPFIFSNALFNMLVPSTDPSFIWKTGINRVILALLTGIFIGIIVRALKDKTGPLFRDNHMSSINEPMGLRGLLQLIGKCFNNMGIYLLTGILINTIFQRYLLWSIIDLFYLNTSTAAVPRFFSNFNVTNPFFLLAMTILYMLLDFIRLSALAILFKFRGIMLYLLYYTCWILLLALSIFS